MTFSLSGIQNKVQQYDQQAHAPAETASYALKSICYAVAQATRQALNAYPGLEVVFSGGVASNTMLRREVAPLNPVFSPTQYATDNAMGVAVLTKRMAEE